MKIQLKRCTKCKALGVGPAAVKLFPLDGELYCKADYGQALDWSTKRGDVLKQIEALPQFVGSLAKGWTPPPEKPVRQDWRSYIGELSGMAGEALVLEDRRTFVHYFARALWAWELSNAV